MAEGLRADRLVRLGDKLLALQYPYFFDESQTDATDFRMLRDVIIFIEDTTIRALTPHQRKEKLHVTSAKAFISALVLYTRTCQEKSFCGALLLTSVVDEAFKEAEKKISIEDPLSGGTLLHDSVITIVESLATVAVTLSLRDSAAQTSQPNKSHVDPCESISPTFPLLKLAREKWTAEHPRRLVTAVETFGRDVSEIFVPMPPTGAEAISEALSEVHKIVTDVSKARNRPKNPDPVMAYADLLRTLRSIQSLEAAQSGRNTVNSKRAHPAPLIAPPVEKQQALALLTSVPLPSGMQSAAKKDNDRLAAEQAIRLSRLLFTQDVRILQDTINAGIGELQDLTATCKTDPRLGRVGS